MLTQSGQGPPSPPLERDWQKAEPEEGEIEQVLMAFSEPLDPPTPDAGFQAIPPITYMHKNHKFKKLKYLNLYSVSS